LLAPESLGLGYQQKRSKIAISNTSAKFEPLNAQG